MGAQSVLARIFTGELPPTVMGDDVLWKSQSLRHLRIPEGPADRTPIAGPSVDGTQAQEPAPYFNTILQRWEMFFQADSKQYWKYSKTGKARGPWSVPVPVLGGGFGGEALMAVQASVTVKGTNLFVTYCRQIGVQQHYMASTTMPTDPLTVPTLTAQAGAIASTASIGNKLVFNQRSCEMPNGGGYLLMADSPGQCVAYYTTATDPSQWPANPFVPYIYGIGGDYVPTLGQYSGGTNVARTAAQFQRPHLFHENGQWILFGSAQGLAINQLLWHRWVCNEVDSLGRPINWILDSKRDELLRPVHLFEQDQQVDVTLARAPGSGAWHAFWAANNNNFGAPPSSGFNILHAPCMQPELAWDGAGWDYVGSLNSDNQADAGWRRCDTFAGDYTLLHLDDVVSAPATHGGYTYTAPVLAQSVRWRWGNAAKRGTNQFKVAVQGTDMLSSGDPVLSMSAVGTTVTINTQADHHLTDTDLVTVSGATPAAYNVNGATITVTGAKSFTYVAAAAPGANTELGVYERSPRGGEVLEYKCLDLGFACRVA